MLTLASAEVNSSEEPGAENCTPGSVRGRSGNWPFYLDGGLGMFMSLRRLLRILIIAEVAFFAVAAVSFYFSLAKLPPPLRSYIESQSQVGTRELVVALALNIPLGIAALIARIGLFFFWRPARALFLIQVVVGTLLLSFGKPLVMTSLAFASESTGVGCVGAILALIYYSPLKKCFEKAKMPPNPPEGLDVHQPCQ